MNIPRFIIKSAIVAVGLLAHSSLFAAGETNRLELEPEIKVDVGSTELQMPILLTNADKLTGFQCDLYLPEGFSVATDEYDDYLIDIARTTTKRHNLATREMPDGALRIVLSSMTNATFSGNSGAVLNLTVGINNNVLAGTYTVSLKNIVLTDPQASRYTAADVTGSIIVSSAEQPVTIKADDKTMTYGDAVPTLTFTAEGAELQGTPSLSCQATSTSPVGTYPIVVTKGTVSNSLVTYVAGTLTIEKAPLTIAAGTYTKKQGEANPNFTLTYNGFKNNETKAVLTKQPTVTCAATTASAPGEYPVTVSGAEAQNYAISYVNGKLVVTAPDPVLAKSITLSKTQVSLVPGETLQLTATVAPDNTSNKSVTWKSSRTSVATVSADGLVTAKSEGSATISATTADGTNLSARCQVTVEAEEETVTKVIIHLSDKQTFECLESQIDSITFTQVKAEPEPEALSCPDDNHPHAIDLGLTSGVKWCCCNVGANKPEDFGGYYSWGEKTEKSVYNEVNYTYYKGSDTNGDGWIDSNLSVVNIGSSIANTSYDVAKQLMGTPWRMPTYTQMNELLTKCTFEWTKQNGVNGIRVTGPNGHYIFLPAAGNHWNTETRNVGSEGCYWTSTVYPSDTRDAYDLEFHSDSRNIVFSRRYDGRSVRATCQ